jgi:peptidyl-prolyl cis-trans isomerase SurA
MLKSFLFLASLISVIQIFGQGKVINKVVAQVGDNVVLLSDLEVQKLQMSSEGNQVNFPTECSILEQLLIEELLLNQALLDSLVVTDQSVDAEMENRLRIIESKMGSRQKLEEFYGKSTAEIKNEFRVQIKNKMLAQEMEAKLTRDLSVTPKEVSTFYASIPKDSIPYINMKLGFQQIVNYPEITKSDKKRAYDALSEIRTDIVANGKSFETMARIHSMDPGSGPQGGRIEASRGMMVPQFESTVFNLKIGEVSEILETMYGYHIIKLISRKGDDYVCLHILIMPEFSPEAINLSAMKMDSCYAMLKENKITWDDAVIRFSNDELTKQNRGVITNPITGEPTWDMEDLNEVDQQIYVLTDAMEKGDVSRPSLYVDIYERKQGVRIVRLMERYEPHKANLKDDYALIKRATENDKKQKTITNWVNNKIGNAYIRIDEDFQNCEFKSNWINTNN